MKDGSEDKISRKDAKAQREEKIEIAECGWDWEGWRKELRFNTRPRNRRRPPDFAPSSETPGGYVGQAVLESVALLRRMGRSERWGRSREPPAGNGVW